MSVHKVTSHCAQLLSLFRGDQTLRKTRSLAIKTWRQKRMGRPFLARVAQHGLYTPGWPSVCFWFPMCLKAEQAQKHQLSPTDLLLLLKLVTRRPNEEDAEQLSRSAGVTHSISCFWSMVLLSPALSPNGPVHDIP